MANTIEDTREHLKPGEVFYYADEFNVSWLPTLRALWSPRGQQVRIPTPGQPYKGYGLGAVNYHTGETVVLFRRRKRRRKVAELLQALVSKHPTGMIYVAWDKEWLYGELRTMAPAHLKQGSTGQTFGLPFPNV